MTIFNREITWRRVTRPETKKIVEMMQPGDYADYVDGDCADYTYVDGVDGADGVDGVDGVDACEDDEDWTNCCDGDGCWQ